MSQLREETQLPLPLEKLGDDEDIYTYPESSEGEEERTPFYTRDPDGKMRRNVTLHFRVTRPQHARLNYMARQLNYASLREYFSAHMPILLRVLEMHSEAVQDGVTPDVRELLEMIEDLLPVNTILDTE